MKRPPRPPHVERERPGQWSTVISALGGLTLGRAPRIERVVSPKP